MVYFIESYAVLKELNVHLTSLLHKVVHTVKSVFRGHLWDN
jgi:hypothetical protein